MTVFSKIRGPLSGYHGPMKLRFALAVLIAAYTLHASDPLAPLSFMSGCWEMRQGPMTVEEQWNKPSGETMLGLSRTLKQGKTVFSEFMRIERRGTEFYYIPRIGTKAEPVAFKMTKISAAEVIFENPAHDFPQRILYRATPEGGLYARIEGADKGKPRHEDFPMKRTDCR